MIHSLKIQKIKNVMSSPSFWLILFVVMIKINIEIRQNSFFPFAIYSSIFTYLSGIAFLGSCINFSIVVINKHIKNTALKIIGSILCVPLFLIISFFVLNLPRIILNASRPADPKFFISNKSQLNQLTELSYELLVKRNIFWVGNDNDGADSLFGITYADGNYLFETHDIPKNYDFSHPLPVATGDQLHQPDIPVEKKLRMTESKILSRETYEFCSQASKMIRKIGFDNVKLYKETNIVQYQIYDFLGWDAGWYYVYYFSPTGALPDDFKYDRKLNNNWYFIRHNRFSK